MKKTILQSILAWLAGLSESLPDTKIETEALLKASAQKIKAGLLPTPAAPVSPAASADAGKVPTVKNDGTYELAAIPTELPTPTAEDNGKFLGVNASGEYALANAGGGSEPYIITFRNVSTGELNTSWSNIENALKQGRPCFINNDNPGKQQRVVMNAYYVYDDDVYFYYVVAVENGALQKWRSSDVNGRPVRVTN